MMPFFFICLGILFQSSLLYGKVVINEFVYDPAGIDAGEEWIELYNTSASTVSLEGWKIEVDENQFPGKVKAELCGFIAPFSYYLIKEREETISTATKANLISGLLTMGNASAKADGIQLLDGSGLIQDRVVYGIVDSDHLCEEICSTAPKALNGSSVARSTPGSLTFVNIFRLNSTPQAGETLCEKQVFQKQEDEVTIQQEHFFRISQNPFFPHGDGLFKEAALHYNVPINTKVTIEIYNVKGQKIQVLQDNVKQFFNGATTVFWNGKDLEGEIVPMGLYIAHLKAEFSNGEIKRDTKIVIMARKL
ncbi:MAG: hypothetical protein A3I11_06630 [Elusimicrobia bacterium RIFCSPLOWO2_02_FULL_39_32]|nr:MAG: hypothetical protein A2034_03300 [Elusimicrobia bacterium GWA2_38_7]OGR81239.1 MAG: hypothetical protein A3B80_09240 [Elusimicrobia bacterium RIFCSPHIGHO2_02_FULL_39_36]OGR91791.1 MAG: hypothetical protein A3I11_06630 [Elusimicrobia bacterium RIFCSPLOWO2_02_FULL_39_32]